MRQNMMGEQNAYGYQQPPVYQPAHQFSGQAAAIGGNSYQAAPAPYQAPAPLSGGALPIVDNSLPTTNVRVTLTTG